MSHDDGNILRQLARPGAVAPRVDDGNRVRLRERLGNRSCDLRQRLQHKLDHGRLIVFFPGRGLLGHGIGFGTALEGNYVCLRGTGSLDYLRLRQTLRFLSLCLTAGLGFVFEPRGGRFGFDFVALGIRLPFDRRFQFLLAPENLSLLHGNLLFLLHD